MADWLDRVGLGGIGSILHFPFSICLYFYHAAGSRSRCIINIVVNVNGLGGVGPKH